MRLLYIDELIGEKRELGPRRIILQVSLGESVSIPTRENVLERMWDFRWSVGCVRRSFFFEQKGEKGRENI